MKKQEDISRFAQVLIDLGVMEKYQNVDDVINTLKVDVVKKAYKKWLKGNHPDHLGGEGYMNPVLKKEDRDAIRAQAAKKFAAEKEKLEARVNDLTQYLQKKSAAVPEKPQQTSQQAEAQPTQPQKKKSLESVSLEQARAAFHKHYKPEIDGSEGKVGKTFYNHIANTGREKREKRIMQRLMDKKFAYYFLEELQKKLGYDSAILYGSGYQDNYNGEGKNNHSRQSAVMVYVKEDPDKPETHGLSPIVVELGNSFGTLKVGDLSVAARSDDPKVTPFALMTEPSFTSIELSLNSHPDLKCLCQLPKFQQATYTPDKDLKSDLQECVSNALKKAEASMPDHLKSQAKEDSQKTKEKVSMYVMDLPEFNESPAGGTPESTESPVAGQVDFLMREHKKSEAPTASSAEDVDSPRGSDLKK